VVILRATRKVLRTLPASAQGMTSSDTALGDWYVNRIVVDRRPLLLLVSSNSLLTILAPAREVKTLPDRVADLIVDRLDRLGVDKHLVDKEAKAMNVAFVGRTTDRSVTGHMVDFAKAIPYYLPVEGWEESTLRLAEDRLSDTPCRCSKPDSEVIFPAKAAIQLLEMRWSFDGTVH